MTEPVPRREDLTPADHNPPARVLFVDHAGVLGGAELYLLDLARHHRATGRVVTFEPGPFPERLREEGVAVEVLTAGRGVMAVTKAGSLWEGVRALPDLVRLVLRLAARAREYDVLFANSQKALLVAGLAGRLAGRPVVWNLHDILTADHFSRVNRRVAVQMANWAARRVIVNSEATRAAFGACGGDLERTALVYNGLDADRFGTVPAAARGRLRGELGIGTAPLVGVFSRLAPWKGQHVLIRALADLPGVHAAFVGGALFGADGAYEAEIRQMADSLGVAGRVHLLGFRDDIPALLQAVDLVAHTSTAPEPFGRVIVEGMLAGKPVVATRAGGALEIIEDGRTGLLVDPDRPGALAEALRRLLSDPQMARSMARRGRIEAQARFSIPTMLERIDRQLSEVVPARMR